MHPLHLLIKKGTNLWCHLFWSKISINKCLKIDCNSHFRPTLGNLLHKWPIIGFFNTTEHHKGCQLGLLIGTFIIGGLGRIIWLNFCKFCQFGFVKQLLSSSGGLVPLFSPDIPPKEPQIVNFPIKCQIGTF